MSNIIRSIGKLSKKTFGGHEITRSFQSPDNEYLRSWRFQKPGTWVYGVDITTAPGWIFVHGDIGFLSLSRMPDMLPWCRGVLTKEWKGEMVTLDRIDWRYLAEKSPQEVATKQFCEETTMQSLNELLADQGFMEGKRAEKEQIIADWKDLVDMYGEHGFYEGYRDLAYCELDEPPQCQDWTSSFIWCGIALREFLIKLDQHEQTTENGEPGVILHDFRAG